MLRDESNRIEILASSSSLDNINLKQTLAYVSACNHHQIIFISKFRYNFEAPTHILQGIMFKPDVKFICSFKKMYFSEIANKG